MAIGNFFQKIKSGLAKTRQTLAGGLRSLFGRKVDQDFLDELEMYLISADVGVDATETILERVKESYENKQADADLMEFVKKQLKEMLDQGDNSLNRAESGPTVIMIAGVNGAGKTTSIAKLATYLKAQEKSVLLGAGDTFRAAAVEQLSTWAERTGTDIVKGQAGGDPAAVAHDACKAGLARQVDYIIIDTAGRLHTQANLMRELEKIHRVIGKVIPDAPHEVIQVLDASNGQNAIVQATQFGQVVHPTGIFLAKLDGTSKGGAAVAIREKLGIPVKFIGVGEQADDLQVFDAEVFVDALFADD